MYTPAGGWRQCVRRWPWRLPRAPASSLLRIRCSVLYVPGVLSDLFVSVLHVPASSSLQIRCYLWVIGVGIWTGSLPTERLVFFCRTNSVNNATCTCSRMCCPAHCASYCTPCQPLWRAFEGRFRSPPSTLYLPCHNTIIPSHYEWRLAASHLSMGKEGGAEREREGYSEKDKKGGAGGSSGLGIRFD